MLIPGNKYCTGLARVQVIQRRLTAGARKIHETISLDRVFVNGAGSSLSPTHSEPRAMYLAFP